MTNFLAKYVGPVIPFIVAGIILTGCALMGGPVGGEDPNNPLGFTVIENVEPGTPDEEVGVLPYDQITPDIADELRREDGTLPQVVLTNKDNVHDTSKFFPIEGFDLSTKEGWKTFLGDEGVQGSVFNLATAFFPGLAAWEGVLTLFSRRKKKHYGNVVKNLGHGKLGVGASLSSLAKAVGGSHTATEEHEEPTPKSGKKA